jgi:hypothetical protein
MMRLSRTVARRLVLCLVAGATVAGGSPALAQAGERAAVPTPAVRQLPTAPVLNGVWCAGPSKCLAVGTNSIQNAPISMTWNGRNWSYLKTPADGKVLSALACTSWTHCLAVGYPGVADEWNGSSWRALRAPGSASLLSIACPSARMCVAVGGSISAKNAIAIRWNGRAWRTTAVPSPAGAQLLTLASVACPSISYCIAVGDYLKPTSYTIQIAMTWNGARWRRAPAPPAKAFVTACPRPHLCVAVSSHQSLMWNRHDWRQEFMPAQNTPESISCPASSFCMVDTRQVTVAWNGRSWSKLPPAHNDTYALWCGSALDCMAVGGGSAGGHASQWNGHTWRALRVA